VNVIVFAAIPDATPAASGVKVTTYFPALLAVSVTGNVPAEAAAEAEVTVPVAPELASVADPTADPPVPTATVEVAPDTFVVIEAVTTTASPVAPAVNADTNEPAAVEDVPPNGASTVAAATVNVPVAAVMAAVDGTIDSVPNPTAATATSAMRLKVVFVDICFLSIVDLENFPSPA
jgi:hypothetical protein